MDYSIFKVGDMPVSEFFNLMILTVLSIVFIVMGPSNLFVLFFRWLLNFYRNKKKS